MRYKRHRPGTSVLDASLCLYLVIALPLPHHRTASASASIISFGRKFKFWVTQIFSFFAFGVSNTMMQGERALKLDRTREEVAEEQQAEPSTCSHHNSIRAYLGRCDTKQEHAS